MTTTLCPLHLSLTHNGQCRLSNYLGSPSVFEHLGNDDGGSS